MILDLRERKSEWKYLEQYDCYFLERVSYCRTPEVPSQQAMNIFVPAIFMTSEGEITTAVHENGFTAATVPVIFENGLAGYMEAEPFDIEDGRSAARDFLANGFVYVSCGCRGRSSVNDAGIRAGKSPRSLVDLKAGIRFLRHNSGVIPGDMNKIISVGISAGGAMSSLLGSTGNSSAYDEELRLEGAVMDQRDDIFAAQCYCPIIDLDHADLAYEWMFRGEKKYTGMPFVGFGPGELTPFAAALSDKLADEYVNYFNGFEIKDPQSGELMRIGKAHEGSALEYLMRKLEDSASKFLSHMEKDEALSGAPFVTKPSTEGYLKGKYERKVFDFSSGELNVLGGRDLTDWLSYTENKVRISSIEDMHRDYHKRLKLCPAFDDLDLIQAENQEFGTPECDKMHFNIYIADMIESLKEEFPDEAEKYLDGYLEAVGDEALARRRYLINPMNFIGTGEKADLAPHYRIRVGSQDADTSLMITMTLALKLLGAGCQDVNYEIVWDEPHGRADYPGEVAAWVKNICR